MTTRVKQLSLVLLAQTACLGVGLWMQHRFVAMSVADAATEDAWSDMETGARDFAGTFVELQSTSTPQRASSVEDVRKLLSQHRPTHGDVAIVDAEWRLAFEWVQGEDYAGPRIPPGQRVSWIKDPGGAETAQEQSHLREGDGPSRGFVDMPNGRHVAVAYPVHGGAGYVLIHSPLMEMEQAAAEVLQSLPAISALTLLWTFVLTGVAMYMILSKFHDRVDHERALVSSDTLKRKQNLIRTRDAVIFGLAKLADSRDPETGQHLERISLYATTLASALRQHAKFSSEATSGFVRLIGISSALHDIGKVGVEDAILLKPGKLTKDERARMQLHSTIGGRCLQEIEQRLGSSNFLQMAREIAYAHHERWDGTGYPYGLAGTEIPLASRIVAIVDVYDALSSRRVYKEPMAHDICVDIIRDEAGRQFDPDLAEVWLKLEQKFRSIARQYADPASGEPQSSSAEVEPDTQGQRKDEHLASILTSSE